VKRCGSTAKKVAMHKNVGGSMRHPESCARPKGHPSTKAEGLFVIIHNDARTYEEGIPLM
jgi:hypothetical protein